MGTQIPPKSVCAFSGCKITLIFTSMQIYSLIANSSLLFPEPSASSSYPAGIQRKPPQHNSPPVQKSFSIAVFLISPIGLTRPSPQKTLNHSSTHKLINS